MTIFNLPNDTVVTTVEAGSGIIIREYSASGASFRGKSILNKNAVSLVIKGEKIMRFAKKTVEANDREIHFLSAGNCITSIDFTNQEEFRSILIFFDDSVFTDFLIRNDKLINELAGIFKYDSQPYISLKKDDFISNYILSLQLIFKTGNHFSEQMKKLKFEELLQYMLEKYPEILLSFQASVEKPQSDIEIKRIVETNITSGLSVDELAFLCNLSSSTFKRRFAKIYKTSPQNWFVKQKMKMAADMLDRHKEKPGEIFYKLGYENHSSFTKTFRKFYGMSPKEFTSVKLNA